METKYIVNNARGQTINGNVTINGGLTITGDTSIRPYKVYTALLTQSGGDGYIELNSGELTIGVTYRIEGGVRESDFTNVGAPNNEVGTSFVATGTTPASWGINEGFGAILSYNTGAPVVTVLENTIGNVWFTYSQPGNYRINSNSLFIGGKTFCQGMTYTAEDGTSFFVATLTRNTNSRVDLSIASPISETSFDNLLSFDTPIEIRVYN